MRKSVSQIEKMFKESTVILIEAKNFNQIDSDAKYPK